MRIVDVLLTATLSKPDTNTLAKIAEKCRALPGGEGFHASRLSDYLAWDGQDAGRKPPARHLTCLATVIGGDPSSLMDEVSEQEMRELLTAMMRVRGSIGEDRQDAAPAPVSGPAFSAPETKADQQTDRVSMLDRKLLRHLIRSVEKSDENTEAVIVYKVAASRPDEDTPREPDPAFIPRDIRKLLGKGGIALRICGESMLDAGIEPGDIVFAKRPASRPADRSIVVALLHGATTCKRLVGNELIAESPVHEDHAPIEDDAIIGVVQAIYKPDRSST